MHIETIDYLCYNKGAKKRYEHGLLSLPLHREIAEHDVKLAGRIHLAELLRRAVGLDFTLGDDDCARAHRIDLFENVGKEPSRLSEKERTVLYVLMGISAAMICTDAFTSQREKRSALFTYTLSLIVNFFWSIIFFNMRAFFFAFLWLLLLFVLIIRTIMKYRDINPTAAYLQIPYAIWVSFAGYLTAAIWFLNK